MRRLVVLGSIVLVLVVGVLVSGYPGSGIGARARGSGGRVLQPTPAPPPPAGLLGQLDSTQAPGKALSLVRVVIPVGGGVAPHTHPGETIWHLETGSVAFTLLAGNARLVRAADGAPAAATPTAGEAIPVGAELTLAAGDTLYFDASALQTERNLGETAAVILGANLRGRDEPLRRMAEHPPHATPAT
jgi:hypothetical protein